MGIATAVVAGLGTAAAGVAPATAATGPDLTVPSVAAPPSSVMAGVSMRVSAKVTNTGNRSAAKTTTRFYLSTDAKMSKGDRLIASKATTSLRAKRSTTVTTTPKLSTATPARTYRLIVCADATSKVRETRESNNCRTATRAIKVTPARADLVISSVTAPPVKVTRGAPMKVTAKVANTGTKSAGTSTTRFYLSTDTKYGTSDRLLTSRSTAALIPGKSVTVSSTPTVPNGTPPGTYHLVVCADAAKKVVEKSETNNCRASTRGVTVEVAGTPPGGFLKTPNPLNVTYTTENVTQKKSFSFPDDIYTVTGADGTTYELRVPINATVTPVDITLRPVTSIDGSPFTGGLGAVEIRPHGLQLLQPATLTITPPKGVSGTPTAFKYAEGGYDFHPYPSKQEGQAVTMQLMSFSTAGAANATTAQIDAARTRYTEQARAQLESAVATGDASDLRSTLEGYKRDVVDPLVEQGKSSDDAAREAISELTNLERTAQLLGLKEGEIVPDLAKKIGDLIAAAMARADQNCRVDHRIDRAQDLMGLARTAALLGDQDLADFAIDSISACLRWRVDYSASYTDTQTWPNTAPFYYAMNRQVDLSVSSRELYLDLTEFTFLPRGAGPLVHDGASLTETQENAQYSSIETLTGTESGEIEAQIDLDLNLYTPPPSKVASPEPAARTQVLTVKSRVLTPLIHHTRTDTTVSGRTTTRTAAYTVWNGFSREVHDPNGTGSEFVGSEVRLRFAATDQNGAILARKRWSDTRSECMPGCSRREAATTEMTLTHAPR